MAKAKQDDNASSHDAIELGNNDGTSIVIEGTHELPANFGLVSLTGLGLLVGTVWPASGGSIQVAIFNGGPPGT